MSYGTGLRQFLTALVVLLSSLRAWPAGGPNIVLITLDSIRADSVGVLAKNARLTPNLDLLAHESVIFGRAYAQAPEAIASTATILTGTYPQTHGANQFGVALPSSVPYLPELLHAAGYRTAAFVGTILLDPRNGPFQGYDRGFERYEADFHLPERGESRFQTVERSPQQVADALTKWLPRHQTAPFFLWASIHLKPALSRTGYEQSARSADAALGRILDALHAHNLYDGSLILLVSSHSESLGAHGEATHGTFVYDETVHVPLLLKLPKKALSGERLSRVRLVDIAPTVLEVAGIPVPSEMQGQSLMRAANSNAQVDQPAYTRGELAQADFGCSVLESWRVGKYLYIRAPQPELYDLSADPSAEHNLAQNSKATLDTMASQLQSFDARLAKQSTSTNPSGLTSSEIQKLASLGYVGLQKTNGGIGAASEGTNPKDLVGAINKTLRAYAELEDGKPEVAMPILRDVLISHPNAYFVQYAMGEALMQQGHEAEAIPHLHKAVELQPNSPWAHLRIGLALSETGDFKTAAVHLEIASTRLPHSSMVHAKLAQVYEKLGREEDAHRQLSLASETAVTKAH